MDLVVLIVSMIGAASQQVCYATHALVYIIFKKWQTLLRRTAEPNMRHSWLFDLNHSFSAHGVAKNIVVCSLEHGHVSISSFSLESSKTCVFNRDVSSCLRDTRYRLDDAVERLYPYFALPLV